ncbi:antibiotic acetyltransferase [Cereibacter sphaeroides]|uniref:Antibiotic acetyltransferase n=1 Tax=Cereibacter sphaeroides TaxID=1063 RepID=A0AAX1UG98_CERSP|nr:CatB-related O-acetyltransferase [Cereibacter sphaeroides]RHZ91729.1 antibiotic acetyltransferase [Cereibacter sphaeroides]
MAQIPFDLKHADFARLAEVGLRLPGLREVKTLTQTSWIEAPTTIIGTVVSGAELQVGAFCSLSGGTLNNVHIGRYSSIAAGTIIGVHEHPTSWLTTSRTSYWPQVYGWDELIAPDRAAEIRAGKRPFTRSCPITEIGHDVWIGQGCFIKSGVRIGHGSVIGARATVTKDVPPYSIVLGTPGRVVRTRVPEALIERLLAVEWWRYSIYDLFAAPFDDVARALDVIEDRIAEGAIKPYEAPLVTPADLAEPLGMAARLAARFPRPLARAS